MIIPNIIVSRYPSEKEWTLSEFNIVGTKFGGVGVEDEYRAVKIKGETRIPTGVYELGFHNSPKFSKYFYVDKDGYLNATKTDRFTTPHYPIHVLNVPNFEYVLWHWGNSEKDTDACYIVGSKFETPDMRTGRVLASKIKYVEIYPIVFQMMRKNKQEGLKTYVEYKDKTS